jgi:hypothetical protein
LFSIWLLQIWHSIKKIFDEAVRILNSSGFLESTTTFYPSPSGSADYVEFTVIATLNGRVYAGYWTDVSEGVPEPIRNLPHIMAYVIRTGRVFLKRRNCCRRTILPFLLAI